MSLEIGIVGLPNVGKSTLFNALLKRQVARVAEYPFTTIEPNVGTVEVPDTRLDKLLTIVRKGKKVPAAIKFIDIAGLVKNAHLGEGLGNQFLSHIREVDAILHVLRFFEHPNVVHMMGKVDPKRDLEIVNLELVLKDLETVGKGIEKAQKEMKVSGKKGKEAQNELFVLQKLKAELEKGKLVSQIAFLKEEQKLISQLFLLTAKPMLFVLNVDERKLTNLSELKTNLHEFLKEYEPIVICAKLEEELDELSETEQKEYLKELGVDKSGLDKVISACYNLLDLVTMFTIAGDLVQAWPVKRDSTVVEAAEKIHTDFAQKFIKAEVVSFETLEKVGSYQEAKAKGLVRFEGRDYAVQDGDVVTIKI